MAASGLAYEELVELVEFGVLQISEGSTGWIFQSRAVHQARRVVKLRDSFGSIPPAWPWPSPTWRRSRRWSSGCANWSVCCPVEAWVLDQLERFEDLRKASLRSVQHCRAGDGSGLFPSTLLQGDPCVPVTWWAAMVRFRFGADEILARSPAGLLMQSTIVTAVLLPLALAVVMLGMGLSLVPADFRRVRRYPRAVAVGLVGEMLLLPLIGLLIVRVVPLQPDMAVGLMVLRQRFPWGASRLEKPMSRLAVVCWR